MSNNIKPEDWDIFAQPHFVTEENCDLPNDTTIESEWVKQGYENIMTHCKRCGKRVLYDNHGNMELSNFCPRCGARMKKQ